MFFQHTQWETDLKNCEHNSSQTASPLTLFLDLGREKKMETNVRISYERHNY